MTGQGHASGQDEKTTIVVEIRTVNNRYLKVSIRTPDRLSALEPKIDQLIRDSIRRGSVQLDVSLSRHASVDDFSINSDLLSQYYRKFSELGGELNAPAVRLESLLELPGVLEETAPDASAAERVWPAVEKVVRDALEQLVAMRQREGQSMAADLSHNCQKIRENLDRVRLRAPQVVENYRTRMTDRLNQLLDQFGVQVEASDVVREIGIFSERSDISEEIVRLDSHLKQFDEILKGDVSNGRKLDFLTQEMFREVNTIGSKANDAEIAVHVVEVKSLIERIREMVQNVE